MQRDGLGDARPLLVELLSIGESEEAEIAVVSQTAFQLLQEPRYLDHTDDHCPA